MEPIHASLLIVAVLSLFAVVYFIARVEVVWRIVQCPRRAIKAEVEVVRRVEGEGKPVRIRSCSLFDDPRRVRCAQECLKSCV